MGTSPSNKEEGEEEDREDDGDGHHEEEDHQELELHDRTDPDPQNYILLSHIQSIYGYVRL